jgi:hypothetical protein
MSSYLPASVNLDHLFLHILLVLVRFAMSVHLIQSHESLAALIAGERLQFVVADEMSFEVCLVDEGFGAQVALEGLVIRVVFRQVVLKRFLCCILLSADVTFVWLFSRRVNGSFVLGEVSLFLEAFVADFAEKIVWVGDSGGFLMVVDSVNGRMSRETFVFSLFAFSFLVLLG